jgi:hypothetical protein
MTMKRFTLSLIFAAAAATVAAGSASAQMLKAEIPFTFRAAGAQMGPGTYTVITQNSAGLPHFVLKNVDTGKAAILTAGILTNASRTWKDDGTPRIAFQCIERRCSLQQIWGGGVSSVYEFPTPKVRADESSTLTEIRMTTKAD